MKQWGNVRLILTSVSTQGRQRSTPGRQGSISNLNVSNLNVNFTREYHCNVRHTFTNMKQARATEISAQTTRINLKSPCEQSLAIPPFGCHQALNPSQGAQSSSASNFVWRSIPFAMKLYQIIIAFTPQHISNN